MRQLLRSRWMWVLLIWTAFIAVPIAQLWPAANTPQPPCNYQGIENEENGLPTCPPDGANYEAIGMSLLVVLWLAGIVIGLLAFAISRFLRRQRRRRSEPQAAP